MKITLNGGQKHLLGLVEKDADADGWTPVSKQVFPLIAKVMPTELVELESVGNEGCGRARLTEDGTNLMRAMEWL